MLNSKQRAYLNGLAANIDPTFQIGKGGVNDAQVAQIDDYLRVHELIKIKVLENAPVNAREVAQELAEKTGADVVQVIGWKFILYRESKEHKEIKLVK